MRMDLLSSYDDETSSTPKNERLRPKEDCLPSELNNGNNDKEEETSLVSTLQSQPSQMEIDEDDESHLPPGVRKKNRIHNSSSSSSSEDESEKGKHSKDVQSSDSDSEKSDSKSKHESTSSSRHHKSSKSGSKRSSRDQESSGRSRRSRSRSGSRSRSRSRSPRRRRRSSDRSRHSRSRSRDRRHKKDKHRRSHRSRSRDRRRSRDRHRHKRDRRRSRSRSRDRRDRRRSRDRRSRRSRGRYSRSRSRSGDRRRDRSYSRSPSPVGKVIKFGDKVIKPGASFGRPSNFSKPLTFKEKMRQQLIKAMEDGTNASEALNNKDGVAMCTQTAGVQQHQPPQLPHPPPPKPKNPPVPLMAIVPSTASLAAMTVTASQAAMQSMLALQKEATEKTGVEIPKYYNPAAINPMKYAEQVQKRKLLWSKSKEKEVKSQWHATSLSGDHDDKSKEKFRKLMGIKEEEGEPEVPEGSIVDTDEEKQKQIFDQLDKEYQFARMATHTHRGLGLGFGAAGYQDPPT